MVAIDEVIGNFTELNIDSSNFRFSFSTRCNLSINKDLHSGNHSKSSATVEINKSIG